MQSAFYKYPKLSFRFRTRYLPQVLCLLVLLSGSPEAAGGSSNQIPFPDDHTLVTSIADEISRMMRVMQPEIKGHVLSTDSGVFLNVGSNAGVTVGMRFSIKSPNSSTSTIVQVERVEEDFSHALIISGPKPDMMYGATLLRDQAMLEYTVPDYIEDSQSRFFLDIAGEVEARGGWAGSYVGNANWGYTLTDQAVNSGNIFMCDIGFLLLMERPYTMLLITDPGGYSAPGGFPYSGEWLPVMQSRNADDPERGWYRRMVRLPSAVFAIDAADINGDGADELITADSEKLYIYSLKRDFLEPEYIKHYDKPVANDSRRGDLGYLGVLNTTAGWSFYIRGPRQGATSVLAIGSSGFEKKGTIEEVPVAGTSNTGEVTLARTGAAYHEFSNRNVRDFSGDSSSNTDFPSVFTFCATGDFFSTGVYTHAMTDSDSVLWTESGGGWENQGFMLGAGIWATDINGDGLDDLIATGRNISFDQAEYYSLASGGLKMIDTSPTFEGRIKDLAFGDFNGDGSLEPAILLAQGFEGVIIF